MNTKLKKQIGGMIIAGFEGTDFNNEAGKAFLEDIQNGYIGGVILFARNIQSPSQLKKLTSALLKARKDLIISIDQEGGKVQRLNKDKGFTSYPTPAEVAGLDAKKTEKIYDALAKELTEYNINLNFAPLVDINNSEKPCPIIGALDRSFGDNPEIITKYANICIDSHHKNNVLTCLKHFPGHGYANADSHLGMVDVTNDTKEIELVPFYNLMHKSDMIMTAHIINKNIDPVHPATLSPITLKTLLRDKGYDGIIIGDDLHMGAIQDNYSLENSIILSLKAGINMLIFSNNHLACQNIKDFKPNNNIARDVIDIIMKAIDKGEISKDIIEKSASRINKIKEKLSSLIFSL